MIPDRARDGWFSLFLLAGFFLLGWVQPVLASPPAGVSASETGSEDVRRESDMKGTILRTFRDEKMIILGDTLIIQMDPSKVMKGDLLVAYRVTDTPGKKKDKNRLVKRGGLLRVVSVSEGMVTGDMVKVTDVLHVGDRLDYYLPQDRQENRYFPFLKRMVDLYWDEKEKHPISVLFMDVTDPEGNVTNLSESVYLELNQMICGRSQMQCISREAILANFNQYGVTTSKSVDTFVERGFLGHLKPDVWIRAEVRSVQKDLIEVRLSAVDPYHVRDRIEYSLRFDPSAVFFSKKDPGEVLVSFTPVKRARFNVFSKEVKTVNEKNVDYFHFDLLGDKIPPDVLKVVTSGGKPLVAGDFFLDLDGDLHPLDKDNVYFNDLVPIGTHRLKVGFYPMIRTTKGSERVGAPILNSFDLTPQEGEEWNIEVNNLVMGDKAYILVTTSVHP